MRRAEDVRGREKRSGKEEWKGGVERREGEKMPEEDEERGGQERRRERRTGKSCVCVCLCARVHIYAHSYLSPLLLSKIVASMILRVL